ncbi:MAG: hypothetical protein AAAFM81_03750 [Pseudomonadota bacterium]
MKEQSTSFRRFTHKAALVAAVALPFAATSVQAQDLLTATEYVPDHAAIQAMKVPSPGAAFSMPNAPIIPDPRISILPPDVAADEAYWQAMQRARAGSARFGGIGDGGDPAVITPTSDPILYTEEETEEGANDTFDTAERIQQLRTGKNRKKNVATVSGSLGQRPENRVLTQTEDDGAIPLALDSGVSGTPDQFSFSGVIGDGPNPGVTSDYDMVKVTLPAGTTFEISVATPEPFGDLDPFVTFYLEDGTIIFQQDDGGDGFDTFVQLTVGANDLTFIMAIGGFGAFEPLDPFDSSAGSITGLVGSEGTYDFSMFVFPNGAAPTDVYTFKMDKGDVLGAAARVDGNPILEIFNMDGDFEKGVAGFGSFADPNSPLPINGNGVIDYVAEASGTYGVSLTGGFGEYELDIGIYRPGFEEQGRRVQLIWLDYNGGPVSKEPWFGFPLITDHTPFSGFLPAWGLPDSPADVRRITTGITAEVSRTLGAELAATGVNPWIRPYVLGNDGTGIPSFLEPFIEQGRFEIFGLTFEVSVVEVSGTTQEAFINTIGIASSIDPGNYGANDVALMLLDVLSAPATPGANANGTFSLNDVILAPGVTKEQLVIQAIANVTSHEAGHYLGNFHTDGVFSSDANIMDEGPGGLFNLAGIGPSGIFGADDTVNVQFIDDTYSVLEGFQGDENTTVNTGHALSFSPRKEIERE